MSKQETRIKRGHVTLMKHPQTALYSGVMLMGTSSVEENVATAYTDGVNKRYGRKFLESIISEPKVRGLILHENLHVALKQVVFGRAMFLENSKLANLAADFVVNDIITCIDGVIAGTTERIVELPDGAVCFTIGLCVRYTTISRRTARAARAVQARVAARGAKVTLHHRVGRNLAMMTAAETQ